jgi:tetratricopeptide (TPR) repeat protein
VSQGESLTVREALDRGADKIAAELDDQPATKLAILVQMGSIYRQLGYYDKAQEILDRARELAESGTDIDTASLAEFGLASGNLSHDQGNYDATETSYLDALARLREFGEDSRDYAVLLNDLGDLYVDMGRYGLPCRGVSTPGTTTIRRTRWKDWPTTT